MIDWTCSALACASDALGNSESVQQIGEISTHVEFDSVAGSVARIFEDPGGTGTQKLAGVAAPVQDHGLTPERYEYDVGAR